MIMRKIATTHYICLMPKLKKNVNYVIPVVNTFVRVTQNSLFESFLTNSFFIFTKVSKTLWSMNHFRLVGRTPSKDNEETYTVVDDNTKKLTNSSPIRYILITHYYLVYKMWINWNAKYYDVILFLTRQLGNKNFRQRTNINYELWHQNLHWAHDRGLITKTFTAIKLH